MSFTECELVLQENARCIFHFDVQGILCLYFCSRLDRHFHSDACLQSSGQHIFRTWARLSEVLDCPFNLRCCRCHSPQTHLTSHGDKVTPYMKTEHNFRSPSEQIYHLPSVLGDNCRPGYCKLLNWRSLNTMHR